MRKSDLPHPRIAEAEVADVRQVNQQYIDILLQQETVARNAIPGQFVMVRSWPDGDPILLRPFDIVHTDPDAGTFRIVIKVSGKGTALLSSLKKGDKITVTGPLGRGILSLDAKRIGLLVRGVGAAAVVFTAEWARARGIEVITFFSAATGGRLVCRDYLEAASDRLFIATDDGTAGHHGDARDLLDRYLKGPAQQEHPIDALFTCGSRRFARTVQELSLQGSVQGYIFLEEYMACGMGDCHGCAVRRADGDGYMLVCQEGPIFDAGEVQLD